MRRRVAAAGSSPHRSGFRLVVSGRALRRSNTNRRHGRAASAIRRNPAPPTRHNPDGVRSRHPARRNPSLRGCRFQTLHNLDRGECVAFFRPFPTFCIARTKFDPAFSSAKTFASGHSFSRPGTIRTGFCFAIGSAKRLVCAARMHGKTSRGPPARNRRAGGPRDTEPETCSSQGGERRTNATQPIGTTAAKRATDRKKRAV